MHAPPHLVLKGWSECTKLTWQTINWISYLPIFIGKNTWTSSAAEKKILIRSISCTVTKLDFFRVVCSGVGQFNSPTRFIFQEELIWYQYNFIKLLNDLFKVCSKLKNADIFYCNLMSLVCLQQENVKKFNKMKIAIEKNS